MAADGIIRAFAPHVAKKEKPLDTLRSAGGLKGRNQAAAKPALSAFVQREAATLECLLAVHMDCREDAVDLLFVVSGDLFEGERTVLPLMRRLRDNFPDVPFDVMVMPASRYNANFKWGIGSTLLFERRR